MKRPLLDIKRLKEEISGFSLKSLFSSIIKAWFIIFLCSIAGTLLLTGVFSLPRGNVENNTIESAYYLKEEGMYPHLFSWCSSRLDNATDSIMIMESVYDGSESALDKAMYAYRRNTGEFGPYVSMIEQYTENVEPTGIDTYPRYWHGYLLFMKPLLSLVSFKNIRIINGTLQCLLILVLVWLMYRNGMKKYIIPYLIAYLILMPVCMAYCIQFSTSFYVMIIMCIAMLVKKNRDDAFLFLLGGAATSYFDFLTYPIVTFAVAFLFYLVLNEEKDMESKLVRMVCFGTAWAFGYAVMWANKWIFSSILTDSNTIADAISSIIYRTGGSAEGSDYKANYLNVIAKNYKKLLNTPFTLLFACFVLFYGYRLFRKKRDIDQALRIAIPFLIVAIIPVLWYVFAVNHSDIHEYFTCKSAITSVLSLMFLPVSIYEAQDDL